MQQGGTEAFRLCVPVPPIAQGSFRACRTHTVISGTPQPPSQVYGSMKPQLTCNKSALDNLPALIHRYMRHMPQRNI